MSSPKTFSIVVPVYQNEMNLDETVSRLLSLGDQLTQYKQELVFVNDGSSDQSYWILMKYHERHPNKIVVVNLTKNFGQLVAIQAGLTVARGDCVGIISADLQDPHEVFVDMVRSWEKGTKLVVAERKRREDSFLQRLSSRLFWRLMNKLAVQNYPIGGFDFCLIDRQIVEEVNRAAEKNSHVFLQIFNMGFKPEIIRYERKLRGAGKSQWTLAKKLKLFVDAFVAFSYVPIRSISCLGLVTAVLSLIYAGFTAVDRLVFGNPVEGWTTIVVLVSVLGGMILFTLGIIGEYIWRILDETRKRPGFIIEKIHRVDRGEN